MMALQWNYGKLGLFGETQLKRVTVCPSTDSPLSAPLEGIMLNKMKSLDLSTMAFLMLLQEALRREISSRKIESFKL